MPGKKGEEQQQWKQQQQQQFCVALVGQTVANGVHESFGGGASFFPNCGTNVLAATNRVQEAVDLEVCLRWFALSTRVTQSWHSPRRKVVETKMKPSAEKPDM